MNADPKNIVVRSCTCLAILFILAGVGSSQSGRTKPTATPTPKIFTGPSVLTLPAPSTGSTRGLPSPTPTATPKDKTDDDVIKVDASLVPVPAAVTDQYGRPITDLRLADFELRVDGKLVEISDLLRAETPIRMAMLFDNSSSVMTAREFEKDAAIGFFRRVLRPDRDQAALFSVADYTELEQPLTRDVSILIRAIEAFPPPSGATALLDGIVEVAEYLKGVEGRRVIVIVSDGEDTYSNTSLETVVRTLHLHNCQVFVVKTKDFEDFRRTGVRGGNANTRSPTSEHRMLEITQQTGGSVYSPIDENELKHAFDQISADLSQQYILSYYPEDDAGKKGAFRNISLTVKGKPNLKVRARKGYYVPKR